VLFCEDGYVKLADFGLSKFLRKDKIAFYDFYDYLAPEIIDN